MPTITVYVTDEVYSKLLLMDYPNPARAAQHIVRKYFKIDEKKDV